MITADLVKQFLHKGAAASLIGADSDGFESDANALAGRGGMSGGLKTIGYKGPAEAPAANVPNYERPKNTVRRAAAPAKTPKIVSPVPEKKDEPVPYGMTSAEWEAHRAKLEKIKAANPSTKVGTPINLTAHKKIGQAPSADDKAIDQAMGTLRAQHNAPKPGWVGKAQKVTGTQGSPNAFSGMLDDQYKQVGSLLKDTNSASRAARPGYGQTFTEGLMKQEDTRRAMYNEAPLVGADRKKWEKGIQSDAVGPVAQGLASRGYADPNIAGTGAAGDPAKQVPNIVKEINTRPTRLQAATQVTNPALKPYAPQINTESMEYRDAVPGENQVATREYKVNDVPFIARENVNTGKVEYVPDSFFNVPAKRWEEHITGKKKINADDVAQWGLNHRIVDSRRPVTRIAR